MSADDPVRYLHDRVCPRCHQVAYRIPRRFIDVLLSQFVPVWRYRCATMGCSWEGNLRPPRPGGDADHRETTA